MVIIAFSPPLTLRAEPGISRSSLSAASRYRCSADKSYARNCKSHRLSNASECMVRKTARPLGLRVDGSLATSEFLTAASIVGNLTHPATEWWRRGFRRCCLNNRRRNSQRERIAPKMTVMRATRFRPPTFENLQLPRQLILDCQSILLGSARRYSSQNRRRVHPKICNLTIRSREYRRRPTTSGGRSKRIFH